MNGRRRLALGRARVAAWPLLLCAVGLAIASGAPVRATEPGVERIEAPPDRTLLDVLAERLRERLTEQIEAGSSGEVLAAVRVDLPEDTERPDALVDRLLSPALDALADRNGLEVLERETTDGAPGTTARAAAARGIEHLVHLRIARTRGHLKLEVRSWKTGGEGWLGLFSPEPTLQGEAAFEARLDAQIFSYLGAPPSVRRRSIRARRSRLPGSGYVGAAVVDLDGEAPRELVLTTTEQVTVLRWTKPGRLQHVGDVPIEDLPPASSPPRRPVGTVVPDGSTAVARVSTYAMPFRVHMQKGVVRLEKAKPVCPEGGFPLRDGCAVPATGRDWFARELRTREESRSAHAVSSPPGEMPSTFYVRRSAWVRQPDGSTLPFEALVSPNGRLLFRVGRRRGGARGYGAALGAADLDRDGTMEILTSDPVAPGEPDTLRLQQLRPSGARLDLWKSQPLDGSVLLAGAGDLDGDALPELLAVEEQRDGAYLWVVR